MTEKIYNFANERVHRDLFLKAIPKGMQKYAQVFSDYMEAIPPIASENGYHYWINYYPDTSILTFTFIHYMEDEDYSLQRFLKIGPEFTYLVEIGQDTNTGKRLHDFVLYKDIERSTVAKIKKVIERELLTK
jgi:hypothetical protein